MQPEFYSQHGEDYILWSLFQPEKNRGYYVEIGALDGLEFSNSYVFELAGWDGICVEAHPNYIEDLQKNRPNSKHYAVAAGDKNGTVTFYSTPRGSLSTIVPEMGKLFEERKSEWFDGFEPITVPLRTLDSILEEVNPSVPIDFISIDVEGAELLVLKGFDINRYKPRVVIAEAMELGTYKKLRSYFNKHHYVFALDWYENLFFCRDRADAEFIQSLKIDVEVIHTPNRVDTTAQPTTRRFMDAPIRFVPSRWWLFKHHVKRLLMRISGYR